jgi:hypothetical protein
VVVYGIEPTREQSMRVEIEAIGRRLAIGRSRMSRSLRALAASGRVHVGAVGAVAAKRVLRGLAGRSARMPQAKRIAY